MKRIGVLTSGGDAPGMNAAIRAVVRTASYLDMSVVGFKRGYNGLLMQNKNHVDDYEILTGRSVSGIIHRGGTFLMTARCKEFLFEEYRKEALDNMRSLGLEGLVVIGGDGSFAGAYELNRMGFPTVGIPGTIDNDLAYTDYTLGFDTAVNTACECVNHIRETSESHERASLVTVMGRGCGDIAIHTALACGAEFALVPEVKWSVEEVAARIKWGVVNGKRSTIIIFAEGAFSSLTSDLPAICERHDALSDIRGDKLTSSKVAEIIEVLSGHETRATVLGYIQRGGTPSAYDRILAARLGSRAVELLRDDRAGLVVGVQENRVIEAPIAEIQGVKRPLNAELKQLVTTLSL